MDIITIFLPRLVSFSKYQIQSHILDKNGVIYFRIEKICLDWKKNVKPINKFLLSINTLLLELQNYKLKGICNFTFYCILVLL